MNIVYETTKERGSTILIPTSMADSMNPGTVLNMAAFGASRSEAAAPAATPVAAPAPVARG
jgi:hypothetical protein